VHNGIWYSGSTPIYSYCPGNSTRRWCSSGNWSSETCAHGCVNGTCQSASTTDGTTSYDNVTTTQTASITIISYPSDFNITQNETTTKSLKVKNNGDFILYNITLELSGTDFHSITPNKINNMSINAENTFSINFRVPANATVKEYTVTATVKTSNSSASASASFKIKVLPSEETVETDIIPLYQGCLAIMEELENNITKLEEKGVNTTDIRTLFNSINDKLNQTNSSLENEDYYTANQLLNDANNLIEELKGMIATAEPVGIDLIIVIVIILIIAIAGIIAYLFWPVRQGYKYKESGTDVKDLLKKIKRKKGYGPKK